MDNERRVNPAPAVYAAAVAVLAYGVAVATLSNLGGEDEGAIAFTAMSVGLLAVMSSSVALAVGYSGFRPLLAVVAIGGTVIALDATLAAGVNAINFPSNESEYITIGGLIFNVVFCALAVLVAGFVGVKALSACRRYFRNVNPYIIVLSTIAVNAMVVTFGAASSGVHPDIDFEISFSPPRMDVIPVDGGVLYGLGQDITSAAVFDAIFFTIVPVMFISAIGAIGTIALRRRYFNCRTYGGIVVAATGMAVITSIIAVLVTAVGVIGGIADAKVHHASWGRDLDADSAVVAGIVAFSGCTVVAGLAGAVGWWFQSLRERRQK